LKKHRRGECEFTPQCPVKGRKCRYNHNTLLHGAIAAKPEKKKEEVVTATTDVTSLTSQAGEQSASLRLVKLYVRACDGNKKTICHVMALLDSGSSTTILREEVTRQLGERIVAKAVDSVAKMTYDAFATLLVRAKGIINQCPIAINDDLRVVTPMQLLQPASTAAFGFEVGQSIPRIHAQVGQSVEHFWKL
jgi:hypothetical protein